MPYCIGSIGDSSNQFKIYIMTPKEKALELYQKYIRYTPVEFEYEYAKKCALILVEEISDQSGMVYHTEGTEKYWEEVKKEIEQL